MNNFVNAKSLVTSLFNGVTDFFEIHRGVMNFKYQFTISNKNYIIRCYPKGREFLAHSEYQYLLLFEKLGIRVPHAISYDEFPFAYLIYEKLEGDCLSDVFDSLPNDIQQVLCGQIYENFELMSSIQTDGFGNMVGYNEFKNSSWLNFIYSELSRSFTYLATVNKPFDCQILKTYLLEFINSRIKNKNDLVWSDFNPDNIIVTKEGELAGFIDFEGLIGGDSMLGIGYLQAKNGDSLFYRRLYEFCHLFQFGDIINFYSVFRYLRLVPYEMTRLPNGCRRESVESFLPNSIKIINYICYGK